MKKCPNPKCNMSGIPDEASFCPKCGAKIVCKKKDSQQLLKEALSAWEACTNKSQYRNLKKIVRNELSVTIGSSFGLSILMGVGSLIKGADFKSAVDVGALFASMGFLIAVIILPFVAIIGIVEDKKELKKEKKAFLEKYIQEHEYE